MKYNCVITDIEEDEITILINNIEITGFSNKGILLDIGSEIEVEISFYDDLLIYKSDKEKFSINRKGYSLSYSVVGILNIEERRVESLINFDLEYNELYNYGFLDGEMVEIDVMRINLEFEN